MMHMEACTQRTRALVVQTTHRYKKDILGHTKYAAANCASLDSSAASPEWDGFQACGVCGKSASEHANWL